MILLAKELEAFRLKVLAGFHFYRNDTPLDLQEEIDFRDVKLMSQFEFKEDLNAEDLVFDPTFDNYEEITGVARLSNVNFDQ